METPKWHFHDKSRSYVFGIKTDDGCIICEKFKDSLDQRTLSHIVSVVFSEEFAEKALEKYLNKEPIFDYQIKEAKSYSGPLTVKDPLATKEDKAIWKKQFSIIMQKIRKFESDVLINKSESEKEDEIDQALMEKRSNSSGQFSLFGEVLEKKKRRKK